MASNESVKRSRDAHISHSLRLNEPRVIVDGSVSWLLMNEWVGDEGIDSLVGELVDGFTVGRMGWMCWWVDGWVDRLVCRMDRGTGL